MGCMPRVSRILTLLFVVPLSAASLQERIAAIAGEARGKVAVSCALPGSRLNCDLNAGAHPPMQSVFKLPLAVTALDRIERGEFTLDQPIRFLASDRILPRTYSPLQEKYPAAEVEIPLRELCGWRCR